MEEEIKQVEETTEDVQQDSGMTQEEVDEIVATRLARAEKKHQEELAKVIEKFELEKSKQAMDEKQLVEFEAEEKDREIERLKAELNRRHLEKEAGNLLSQKDIPVTDELIGFVVRENEEQTEKAVEAFVELVNQTTDEKVKQALAGTTPRQTGGVAKATKALSEYDYSELLEVKQKDPMLYQRILKGE